MWSWGSDREDAAADDEDFPLVAWHQYGGPTLRIRYDPEARAYVARDADGCCRGLVTVRALCQIAGLADSWRGSAFPQSLEDAALRYFRHEAFLQTLASP